ncbi:hypothetical protein RvVAT039_04580 [Agrobacterium vitis]|uniref:DUF3164 family protein n=2 Tax=Rhizobium/Agrobacterium group TaxID=227290 RepID=B9JYF1_ALLAM|nr:MULTISPECIES: DUF3164 family protein [Rhizobium/Agrobacterium group]ACM37181.1 Conserved hypothetical protein [Allorhizobium ampelinum S4]MUO30029.1 DUF3164 family protein [Agrobacterium vitis]MUO42393.1 DUF3164 family protein [Agrobacterium vitis]MUP10693.1 DUF3164 family protein [Agrobacterium vitis]BCH63242.1 hypothetical protein RvVAT039_04580 [Agrobacterium vitis]
MEAIILEEKPTDGVTLVNGKEYMANAKGALVPLELVKPQEKLRDESVRKVMAYAVDISARIARFRAHCMDDLDALDAVLEQEYGAKSGGIKGNRTYQTIDGLMRVSVAINDFETAGPELQVAKSLIDECLNEWTSDARVEIRALITRAFDTDKEGKVNLKEIKKLTKLAIEDERWVQAVRAINDAINVAYSKQYIRFHVRNSVQDEWIAVTVDIAKA